MKRRGKPATKRSRPAQRPQFRQVDRLARRDAGDGRAEEVVEVFTDLRLPVPQRLRA